MSRKFVTLFTAAALAVSPVLTTAAQCTLPVGGLDETEMIRFEVQADENARQLPEVGLFESVSAPETGLYSYGSSYGLEYYKENELDAQADLYQKIYDRCVEIAVGKEDAYSYEMFGSEVFAPTQEEIAANLGVFMNEHQDICIQYDIEGADAAMNVYTTVKNDHPEFYWLPSSLFVVDSSYEDGTIAARYMILFASDDYNEASERERLDNRMESTIDEWLGEVEDAENDSVYKTVKQVHDLITREVEYGYYEGTETPLDTEYAHSIIGVFDGDKRTDVVCEGYAKAFQLLLNALDIDNVYVTGLGEGNGLWGGHAWNMVKMDDGQYYNFDVTWDDSTDSYDYFAKGAGFDETHIVNTPNGIWQEIPGDLDPSAQPSFLYELPAVPEADYDPTAVRPVPPAPTETEEAEEPTPTATAEVEEPTPTATADAEEPTPTATADAEEPTPTATAEVEEPTPTATADAEEPTPTATTDVEEPTPTATADVEEPTPTAEVPTEEPTPLPTPGPGYKFESTLFGDRLEQKFDQETGESSMVVVYDHQPRISSILYAASYDENNVLVGIRAVEVTSDTVEVPLMLDMNVATIKLLTWSTDARAEGLPTANSVTCQVVSADN